MNDLSSSSNIKFISESMMVTWYFGYEIVVLLRIPAAHGKWCAVIPAVLALSCQGDSRSTASSGIALIHDLSCLWVVAHKHDVLN